MRARSTRTVESGAYTAPRTIPRWTVRLSGKLGTILIVSAPALWPLARRPARKIWNRMAGSWDAGIQPDSADHLAPLTAACHTIHSPARILEVGTGTGAGALFLARRYPDATVVGVDLAASMVEAALRKRPASLESRVEFMTADAAALPFDPASFDLVVQLNVPPFVEALARVLRPNGHLVIADSLGPATPSHVPEKALDPRLRRHGLRQVSAGRAGAGSYVVAQRANE